jgi:cold-inducible RNA-binding protein
MKIYIGNLSFSSTEDEIRALFSQHGDVTDVAIISDRETGRSRGFGFVEMSNDEAAREAIGALNGADLGGRSLTVNEARPKTDRGPRRDKW